jgi:protein SCO1/2
MSTARRGETEKGRRGEAQTPRRGFAAALAECLWLSGRSLTNLRGYASQGRHSLKSFSLLRKGKAFPQGRRPSRISVSQHPPVTASPFLGVSSSPLLPFSPSPCLRVFFTFALLLTAFSLPALSQPGVPGPSSPLYGARPESGAVSSGLPKPLRQVGIDQKLNEQLPLDIVLRNENGEPVKLGNYFGKKPVIISLVYYECPMLCTQVLNGMVSSFKVLSFKAGDEFEVVTVSFDPRETSALATAKKKTYVGYLPEAKRGPAQNGWHFLTGDSENIKRLTEAIGFHYNFDEKTNQFAHASAIMVATPEGKLARYFYGIEYSPKDLRLGLVEASQNKIGSPVDQLLLYCYHYDPATGKYGAAVMNLVRGGGVATLFGMVVLFFAMRRRNATKMRLETRGSA